MLDERVEQLFVLLPRHVRADRLIAFAIVALWVVQIATEWPFTVDDSYITLRYARNVAAGLGPNFNATGPRAEGYTSALWMLVLVVPHLMHWSALGTAKVLGVLATGANLVVIARWAKNEGGERGAMVAMALYAAMASTAVHAVSGMETALFTLLLTAMLATASDLVRAVGPPRTNRLAVLALLVGLARPEGNLAALVTLAVVLLLVPRAERSSLASRVLFFWIGPMAAYQLWRWHYYGLPFPLPWYVKVASPPMPAGWPDVVDWLYRHPLRLALLLTPALVRPSRALLPALGCVVSLTLFFLLPQHLMGFQHRYLAPLDPTLGVMAGVGMVRAATLWPMHRLGPRLLDGVSATVLAANCAWLLGDAPGAIRGQLWYARGLGPAHEALGRELAALDLPEGRLALSDAGAIPYLSNWWTLDLIGLNTARIATTGRRDPSSILLEKPDVIVLVSQRADRFEPHEWNAWELPLYEASQANGFARVAVRCFDEDYWLWVLARPDSIAGRSLGAWR